MTGPGEVTGLGVDVTAIDRWHSMLAREPGVLDVAFSEPERRWADGIPARAALLWAIKEATVKALGCGFGPVEWHDVVAELSSRPPRLRIPAQRLADLGLRSCRIAVGAGFARQAPPAAVALAVRVEPAPGNRHPQRRAGRVAVALQRFPVEGCRAARRRAERQAAARAAQRGLQALGEPRAYVLIRSADGRPLLRSDVPGEAPLVSVAHCRGWAAAAVGGGAR